MRKKRDRVAQQAGGHSGRGPERSDEPRREESGDGYQGEVEQDQGFRRHAKPEWQTGVQRHTERPQRIPAEAVNGTSMAELQIIRGIATWWREWGHPRPPPVSSPGVFIFP